MNKYNGWTNRPTWVINLWLTNDYNDQCWVSEMAQEAIRESEHDKDDAISILSAALETYIDDATPELPGLFADLLSGALAYVDWRELAAHYIDDEWEDAPTESAGVA